MIVFGGISFTLYPLSITYTCDHFSDKKIIGITCALMIIYGTGCIVGPLVSPLFMAIVGPSGLFLYITLLCALFIIICYWRVLHSKPLSEEEQSDYLPLPRATSLALYLDPHADLGAEEELDEDEDEGYLFGEEDEDEEEE